MAIMPTASRREGGWSFIFFAVNPAAGVQEILVVVISDQFLKFRGGQAVLGQVANVQPDAALFEKPTSFAARGAGWLLKKLHRLPRSSCARFEFAH